MQWAQFPCSHPSKDTSPAPSPCPLHSPASWEGGLQTLEWELWIYVNAATKGRRWEEDCG